MMMKMRTVMTMIIIDGSDGLKGYHNEDSDDGEG